MSADQYVGRFAPSPTGPLHLGSIVAAVASYLDARAHNGRWLIRIEDIDPPREVTGADQSILDALQALHMHADEPALWQSSRHAAYQQALDELVLHGRAYPCTCTKREIMAVVAQKRGVDVASLGGGNIVYPGTCRPTAGSSPASDRLGAAPAAQHVSRAPSWRLLVPGEPITWRDRPAGWRDGQAIRTNLANSTGDFNLRRSDGLWSYQLAVVVDDHFSQVSCVVRGDDLAESTPRQICLQRALRYRCPETLHIPVVRDNQGKKLSKQNDAPPVRCDGSERHRIDLLNDALVYLGLTPVQSESLPDFWPHAIRRWRESGWMQD